MVELILGTAQLGIDYGINNKLGKPNKKQAFEILDYAYKNGIKLLDTASAYGDSEEIIGEYMKKTGNKFNISTKLSPKITDFNEIKYELDKSLCKFGVESIDLYFIHSFHDLKSNNRLIEHILSLKESDKIKSIGISIYDPFELDEILEKYSDYIDVVQIPFNLFDSRWIVNDYFKRASEKNIKIFVRSVFLQGVFFLENKEDMDKIDSSLYIYIYKLKMISETNNIPLIQLAMDYVKSYDNISGILIGCESVNQLEENINLFNKKNKVNNKIKKEIIQMVEDIPYIIVDPRQW